MRISRESRENCRNFFSFFNDVQCVLGWRENEGKTRLYKKAEEEESEVTCTARRTKKCMRVKWLWRGQSQGIYREFNELFVLFLFLVGCDQVRLNSSDMWLFGLLLLLFMMWQILSCRCNLQTRYKCYTEKKLRMPEIGLMSCMN